MSRPNILLITSDQHHYMAMGYNNPRLKTPNLDRLAKEGAIFDRAYCPNPVCSPSRASIITGLYPSHHHCWTIGVKLPEDVPTVGEQFDENGYYTSLIGKAHFQPLRSQPGSESIETSEHNREHLDFWKDFHGPFYGFKHVELARNHGDEYHVGAHYALWMEEKGLKNWEQYFREWPPNPNEERREYSWNLPEEYHYTNWTAERSIAQIDKAVENNKPFFLWSSFHDPHPPYLVPEPWASMYDPEDMVIEHPHVPGEFDRMPPHFKLTQMENPDFSEWQETEHGNHGFGNQIIPEKEMKKKIATYYGMISFMDDAIGRILNRLDEHGIAENTLVVFTTDHGHYLGQHGLTAKGPFHYEDMIRIPMAARFPGKIEAGQRIQALQSLVDLAPSFLNAAGIEIPGMMQGVNQMEVWSGKEKNKRDNLIVENRHQPTAIHVRTYVDDRYKMTVYRGYEYGELFDLQEDPEELRNLWDEPEAKDLKIKVLHKFVLGEIQREPTRMPRIAVA